MAAFDVGTRVLITGASSGIGKFLSLEFARHKCSLALVARSLDDLRVTATECLAGGASKVEVIPGDLSVPKIAVDVVSSAVSALGGVDVVVLNAGVGSHAAACAIVGENPPDHPTQRLEQLMAINTLAPINTALAALPHLLSSPVSGGGRLVLVSSVSGLIGLPMRAEYCASKHAVEGFFESLRCDLEGGFCPHQGPDGTKCRSATGSVSVVIAAPPTVSGTALRGSSGGVRGSISNIGDIDAQSVARLIVDGALLRKDRIWFTTSSQAAAKIAPVFPGFIRRAVIRKAHLEPKL